MSSNPGAERRVVITGVGVISPIGIGVEGFVQGLESGRCGISATDEPEYRILPTHAVAAIPDFSESSAKKTYLRGQRKSIKVMCREIQLGVASAALAVEHAALDLEQLDHSRLGVDFGANQMLSPPEALADGCFACIEESTGDFDFSKWGVEGIAGMEPLWLLKYLPNMPACHIGILADARGPNNSLTQAEASGNLAMGEALRVITRGSADMMIAGTTGSRMHPVKALHACLWEDLADAGGDPAHASRPFELHRSGQVIGEGACSFIFEEEEHAKARGATILGTVLAAGSSCVSDSFGRPDGRTALVNAITLALRRAGLAPGDVGHINAHGLSTKSGDAIEAQAIRQVFGSATDFVPVTGLKGALGNSGAGCGTLELAGSILALRQGFVPATLNYDEPDPECALNIVRENLPTTNKTVLNINVTIAGQASALVVCGA